MGGHFVLSSNRDNCGECAASIDAGNSPPNGILPMKNPVFQKNLQISAARISDVMVANKHQSLAKNNHIG